MNDGHANTDDTPEPLPTGCEHTVTAFALLGLTVAAYLIVTITQTIWKHL